MTKRLLSVLFVLMTVVAVSAQSKIGMLIGSETIDAIGSADEKVAAQWFASTYPEGVIITPSTIDKVDEVTTLWVAIDRVGISKGWNNLPEAFRTDAVVTKLTNHVKAGGSLLLTNHATQLTVAIGRIPEAYAPGTFGNGAGIYNGDTWGSQPLLGNVDGQIYDRTTHAIYSGMDLVSGLYDRPIYCFEGSGVKGDHNCMWDLNTYGFSGDPNTVINWQDATNSTVLGTWNHVVDYCCAGIVDFNPTTDMPGRILAVGLASYEWDLNGGENSKIDQLKMFTSNCLTYLDNSSTKTIDTGGDTPGGDTPGGDTPSVDPSSSTNVAMLIGYNNVSEIEDDDEKAAAQWFQSAYPQGIVLTPSTVGTLANGEINTLWVMVDREGISQGYNNLPEAFRSTATVDALTSFLKAGGNLLLTNHATQLITAIGRVADTYAPNVFGSGAASNNADVWGANANIGNTYDHRSHAIFSGLTTGEFNYGHEIFPFIGSGMKEDHNCMWNLTNLSLSDNPNLVKSFEKKTTSEVLATWGQVTDFSSAGIVEFLPKGAYRGHVIANGMAAYEWKQNGSANTYQSDIQTLTRNCIDYLLAAEPGDGQEEQPSSGDLVAKFDMELNGNNITESVSGNSYFVEGVLARENVLGASGKALRLDGNTTFINAAISSDNLSQSQLTVAAWVAPETYPVMNINGINNDFTHIAGNISGNSGFAFKVNTRGRYGFDCFVDGARIELEASSVLPRYEWSHLVATIDAVNNVVKFYRNGELMAQKSCGGTINVGDDVFLIGRSSRNDLREAAMYLNTFNGLIDDIEIYNKVLSSSEIKAYKASRAADLKIPASRFANDILRPQFHAMAAANWGNETHGAIYQNGQFHVFYQKNANGPYWGKLHWGHLTSKNLCKWDEERTALAPEYDYDFKGCWSGSVFTDDVVTGGKPNILYTAVDDKIARIVQAAPNDDDLINWTKSSTRDGANNPILIDGKPEGLSDDFRDPYFFENNGKRYIIVGTSKNSKGAVTLHRYDASSKSWSNDESIFFQGTDAGANGTFWEMPNVTPMGNGKWLFTCTPQGTSQGVETHYWIGTINDDGTFNPTSSSVTNPGKLELEGMSKDGYGLLSPTIFKYNGKTLLLGIVPDKVATEENYRWGWAHTFSLPREVSLSADGKYLVQKPYEGLKAMRTSTQYTRSNFTLNGTQSLGSVEGRKLELCGEFTVGSGDFGFNFYKSGDRSAKLYYSPASKKVVLDIRNIDRVVQDNAFGGYYESELPIEAAAGSTMKIHVFVDHSIVDVFINDTWAFSVRVFPTNANAKGAEAFANNNTTVKSLQAWTLDEDLTAAQEVTFTVGGVTYRGTIDGDTRQAAAIAAERTLGSYDLTEDNYKVSYDSNVFDVNAIEEGAFIECDNLMYADLTSFSGTLSSPRAAFPANTLIYVNGDNNTISAGNTGNNIVVINSGAATCPRLVVYDKKDFGNKYEFTAAAAEYTRDFSSAASQQRSTTVALPFVLSADQMAALGQFFAFEGVADDGIHYGDAAMVNAYEPYLFIPAANAIAIESSVVVPAFTETVYDLAAQSGYEGVFEACFRNTAFPTANSYLGNYTVYAYNNSGKFATTTGTITVPQMRACVITGLNADAKELSVVVAGDDVTPSDPGEDEALAVKGIAMDKNRQLFIYDLQGRYVGTTLTTPTSSLKKGIYIVGGRKIVVK